ncbi:MAG: hypothetical protein KAX39_02780 [candidate division Zixibacteria bacterium]|nr:hypothetical protein [candidate division Zixibacteria bacterium]
MKKKPVALSALIITCMLCLADTGRSQDIGLTEALQRIDRYDSTANLDDLREGLEVLRLLRYQGNTDPYILYRIVEAELKSKIHVLKNDPKDSALSSQVRSKILEVWSHIAQVERNPNLDRNLFANILDRGVRTIIESGRFLDHANSLAPLVRHILARAEVRNLMGRSETKFSNFSIIKSFMEIDYPNMAFLSHIRRADELDGNDEVECVASAVAAGDATRTPLGQCIALYLAARNTPKEDREKAIDYYKQSLTKFDDFEDPTGEYLAAAFSKMWIVSEFIHLVIDLYGTELWEQKNFARYVYLFEDAWKMPWLTDEQRYSLASGLSKAYPNLITQVREEEKDELAEEYVKRQAVINAYLETH